MEHFRTVPDTNVIIAGHKGGATSPNREYLTRWQSGQFDLLFSDDTLDEYINKMATLGVSENALTAFTKAVLVLTKHVKIGHFHLPEYPSDEKDIPFLLCADNGESSHLISYDAHLLDIQTRYSFRICKPIEFLHDLRANRGE